MAISFVDLFNDINNCGKPNFETQRKRKELLLNNRTDHLEKFLRYAFHPDVKFLLPKGKPPYHAGPPSMNSKLIYGQIRLINYLTNEFTGNLTPLKREQMFIQILESVSPEEAELIVQMKEKKLKVTGLSYNLVQETFPHLLPNKTEASETPSV